MTGRSRVVTQCKVPSSAPTPPSALWRRSTHSICSHRCRKESTLVMHAYVINLARSPDRRAHIVAELQRTGLTYEFIDAVDGRNLDLDDTTLVDPVLIARYSFPAGTAGCSLSHLSAYKKILADGFEHALILEDDIALPTDLNELAEDLASHMTGAEVALL